MALVKIADAYPNYKQDIFAGDDIKGYGVYTEGEEKVGEVHDALLDETGRFRYLVIDTGFWVFGKKVLLPVGRAMMDYNQRRVYVTGLTKEQAQNLPEYNDDMTVNYDYEEQVRNVYRTPSAGTTTTAAQATTYNPDSYDYDYEPALYATNEQNHQKLKLYEERLVANKERYKAGEVAVGKRVETETARVSVPVEKERVIVERTTPSNVREVTPGEADFREGEVARIEVYEESADIQKKAFVREEVSVRKEVERDTVDATETVRREELEVDVNGQPVVHQNR
ncbi:MAG TPA: photosystem reaction center subunit H [Cyanobacteria bacterium UBA11162]|nr:photosystem reaction center subunit H [Cyanobacteria bacterium UBA11162]